MQQMCFLFLNPYQMYGKHNLAELFLNSKAEKHF